MQKFLVVSYDDDEQQWFYDIVFAESADAAKERILAIRTYAIDADVFDTAAMEQIYTAFQTDTRERSEKFIAEIAAEVGKDSQGNDIDG